MKEGLPKKIGRVCKSAVGILPKCRLFYLIAKQYVDNYNGDNNCDLRVNGELRFIKDRLPGSKVVFDVGSNVGDWAKLALSINPSISLHCFEPSAPTFRVLSQNPFPDNVKLNNCGLGSVVEERELLVVGELNGANSLYAREGVAHLRGEAAARAEIIRLDTLDNYCRQKSISKVDFVKIDVEGHELAVLQGARQMLERGSIEVIQFEYGGTYIDARIFLKDIFHFVQDTNRAYRFYKLFPKRLMLVERYSQLLENLQYQNWAIIREG